MPSVKMIPAMPGKVTTVPNNPIDPNNRMKFTNNAKFATTPATR